jgi:hypothetical protein
MNIIVFTGPTLSVMDARAELEATYLPPAAQGDVYRASLTQPVAIGIIDGVFDQVPSVWHKEILWAMSQGIHVFGSASMGALRAAELETFGMIGVGEIFRAYQNGPLEDDDEVAVVHGKEVDGFRVLSDAMVNIRPTLLRAEQEGILNTATRGKLEAIAKNLCYPERSYARVLEIAVNNGVPAEELNALREWLPKGKIDQKREDALEMLRAMRAVQAGLAPKVVHYKFENTVVWNALVNSAGLLHEDGSASGNLSINEILAEVWADPELCLQAYQYAAIRHLVRQAARASGVTVSSEKLATVEATFREDRGLSEQPAFERWLQQHGMSATEFAELIENEALLHESSLTPCPFPHRWMVDWLRITGRYEPILSAAAQKKSSNSATDSGEGNDPEAEAEVLLQWYMERLDSPDDAANASSRAMMSYLRKDWEAFLNSLVKQYRSRQRADPQAAGT